MKADFQKLSSKSLDNSFVDFWVRSKFFGFHWHYHPEIEICHIRQGRGKRIIGESIEDFEDGDLVLVGSNVPHSWITDEQFNKSKKIVENYVVQFHTTVFEPFQGMPEFKAILKLLQDASRGIYFPKNTSGAVIDKLLEMNQQKGFQKLLLLMEVLNGFVHGEKRFLCANAYNMVHKKYQEERILKVCNYIHENYRNNLTITQLSDLVAMNNAAFCRFFKRILGKTVIDYITELRISHVCNQIQNTRDPIYKIAYDTGFSSIAHFNKQFRLKVGKTPMEYRNFLT